MGTTYLVEIDLQTKGSLAAQLDKSTHSASAAHTKVRDLHGAVEKLGEGWEKTGGRAVEAFSGVVEKVGHVALALGAAGVGAALAGAAYGVTHLNNEMESLQISMAAIFGAQGASRNMSEGLEIAADQVQKMRHDAAALPGEFQDLVGIFKTISSPALGAGMTPDQVRSLAANTMAVGAVMGMDKEQTARETAMLLEGRAGAHNILGMRLGFMGEKASELKSADPAKRAEMVQAELKKYEPAIAEFGKSWEGLTSTLVDNGKQLIQGATKPLFDAIKKDLTSVNDWISDNQFLIFGYASSIGTWLEDAWNRGRRAFEEWFPLIREFATNAYGRIAEIWEKVQPYVERVGESIKGFLKDPGALDKIIHALELYAAIKVGGAVGGGILDTIKGVEALSKGAKLLGIGGGAAAATEAAGAANGAGALAKAAPWGGEGLAAAMLAAGGIYLAVDQWNKLQRETAADTDKSRRAQEDFVARLDEASYTNQSYQQVIQHLIDTSQTLDAAFLQAAMDARVIAQESRQRDDEAFSQKMNGIDDMVTASTMAMNGAFLSGQKVGAGAGKHKAEHPGGGGTNIAKVEIVVTTNQDPSRVARVIEDHLVNLKRHPRASRNVPNYSAPRG